MYIIYIYHIHIDDIDIINHHNLRILLGNVWAHTPSPRVVYVYIYTELGRIICCTSWWFQPLWKILVSWDDYPQYMENKHVPNHQSVYVILNMYSSIISLEVTNLLPFLKWGHNYLCTGHLPSPKCDSGELPGVDGWIRRFTPLMLFQSRSLVYNVCI